MRMFNRNGFASFNITCNRNNFLVISLGRDISGLRRVPIQNFKYVFGMSKVFLRCVVSDSSMF